MSCRVPPTADDLDVPTHLETRVDGVRILIIQTRPPGAISHVQVDVSVGDDYESRPDQREVAHFIEHLVASLLRSRKYRKIGNKRMAEELGIASNACTSSVRTSYYMNGTTDLLETMIHVQIGAVVDFLTFFNETAKDDRFGREEQAVRRELASKIDLADYRMYERLNEILYANHPRAISQRTDMENIMHMKPETVREFYTNYYVPSNMVFTVATSVPINDVKKILNQYMFTVPTIIKKTAPLRALLRNTFPSNRNVHYLQLQESRTVRLNLVWPLNMRRFDDDAISASIISNVLSGGFSSRLLHELREHLGDVYSVSAYPCLDELKANFSTFQIETSTSNKKVNEVLSHIMSELRLLCSEGPSNEEMEKYRRRIRASHEHMLLDREPSTFVDAYAEQVLFRGKIVHSRRKSLEHALSITKEEVKRVCNSIFQQPNVVLLYGSMDKLNDAQLKLAIK